MLFFHKSCRTQAHISRSFSFPPNTTRFPSVTDIIRFEHNALYTKAITAPQASALKMERGTISSVREGRGSGSDGGDSVGEIVTNAIDDTSKHIDEAKETGEIDNGKDVEDNSIGRFSLMRLPPELRDHVYRYLLGEPLAINASTMLVPSISHTTALIRRESLGLVTAINEVGFTVRSTYCTVTQGPVTSAHQHFRETGKLVLDTRRQKWFAQDQVVFKRIIIRVICICCGDRCIGMIYIDIVDGQVKSGISEAPVPHQYSLTWTFAQILGRLRPLLIEIHERAEIPTSQGRSKMTKFKYSDLEEVAMCFRFAG
jgi:hypothetical protein